MSLATQKKQSIWRQLQQQPVLKFDQAQATVELIDLSLHGALILRPARWDATLYDCCVLCITDHTDALIEMACNVAHITGQQLGLSCDYIDMHSIEKLRNLACTLSETPVDLDRALIELTAHHPHTLAAS